MCIGYALCRQGKYNGDKERGRVDNRPPRFPAPFFLHPYRRIFGATVL